MRTKAWRERKLRENERFEELQNEDGSSMGYAFFVERSRNRKSRDWNNRRGLKLMRSPLANG